MIILSQILMLLLYRKQVQDFPFTEARV